MAGSLWHIVGTIRHKPYAISRDGSSSKQRSKLGAKFYRTRAGEQYWVPFALLAQIHQLPIKKVNHEWPDAFCKFGLITPARFRRGKPVVAVWK
jgi:hypothetical protein